MLNRLITISGVVFLVAAACQQSVFAAGDPVAGQEKAGLCGGCHGMDGNSAEAIYPRLAGQFEGYILKQVVDFQKGKRTNNETMAGMAAMAGSVEDIKDIGAYFASQKIATKPLTEPDPELVAKGEKIYRYGNPEKDLYGCINCHGEKGTGKSEKISQFPKLVGQHRDYIIKQLNDFKSDTRTNDPARMMSAIAKKMDANQIKAVAEYLSAQVP